MSSVSVLIGTYNGARFFDATLESLDKQDFRNLTVAICDDASTDDSYEIISEWAKKTPHNVILTKNETNLGPSITYEKALSLVDTTFVVLLGQDDSLFEKHISSSVSIAESGRDIVAVFASEAVNNPVSNLKLILKRFLLNNLHPGWPQLIRLLGGNFFFASGTLIRRDIWRKNMMHPANVQAQDFELWLNLAVSGRMIVSKNQVKYGRHDSNLSNCHPIDQDLDLGFAIWRFLNSEFFVNLKSKLDDSDKIVLEKQIEKRLNIHLPTSPIIYSLANLEKNELLQNQKAFEDLNTRILSPALTKNFEGNWGRSDRAKLLAQLYAWDENEKMTDLNLIKLKLRKFLHQIFKYKVLKRFLDGFYDRDIRDLPFPWLETEKISYN